MKIITRTPSFTDALITEAAIELSSIDHTHRVGSQRRWSVVLTDAGEIKLLRADYRPNKWESVIGVVTPS